MTFARALSIGLMLLGLVCLVLVLSGCVPFAELGGPHCDELTMGCPP